MQKDYKRLKITLSVLIIVVLLAYAFIAYMPHGHECADADCVICNLADSRNDFLLNAALLSMAQLLPLLIFLLSCSHERIVSLCESTPVGLKVKLSD